MSLTINTGRPVSDASPLSQDMTEAQADANVAVYDAFANVAMVPTILVTDVPNRIVTLAIARTPNGPATIDWGDGTRQRVTAAAGALGATPHTYAYPGTFQISYSIQPPFVSGQFKTIPAVETVATEVALSWPPPPGSMNPLAVAAFITAHPPR